MLHAHNLWGRHLNMVQYELIAQQGWDARERNTLKRVVSQSYTPVMYPLMFRLAGLLTTPRLGWASALLV